MTKRDQTSETTSLLASMFEAMQATKFPTAPGIGSEWIESVIQMGSEVLNFMATRVQQDVQMQHALMQAKGVAEVQHIQAQFFQKAMDDYAAESAKLLEIGRTIVPDAETKSS